MQKIKKISLYDLNPRYFKDSTGNGVGDLLGLASKIEYFKFLGIDAIILQDVISSNSDDKRQSFTKVSKEVGDINGLILVLSKAKNIGIKIFIEMKIGSIKENNNWFDNAVNDTVYREENIIDFTSKKEDLATKGKYNSEAKAYFPYDENTQEIPLNWKSEKTLIKFVEVIKFWNNIGISGFVFTDYEFIGNKNKKELMNETTLKELRKLYRAIKEVDDSILVIGKSSLIELQNSNKYTGGSTKVFDYFQSTKISLIGTYNKYGKDLKGNFKPRKLFKFMKIFASNNTNIVQFGSEDIGRFISRWGNDGQYIQESAKAFAMLLMLVPASTSIYYGDELGAKNIGLTHLDDFQDETLEERKLNIISLGKSESDFMDAQVLQNPINAKSLMMWNNNKNGGFSISEKTITPPSSDYAENNVEVQFRDNSSILNFYKKVLRISLHSSFNSIIANGDWKITNNPMFPGVIKMVSILKKKEIIVYVNLTNSIKIIKSPKNGKVIISSYSEKIYKTIPKKLEAYESIMISKYTDDYTKELQQIKDEKNKEAKEIEFQIKKDEIEKTREIEIQKNASIKKINEEEKIKEEVLRMKEQERQQVILDKEKESIKFEEKNLLALKRAEKEICSIEKQKFKDEKNEAKKQIKLKKENEKTRLFQLNNSDKKTLPINEQKKFDDEVFESDKTVIIDKIIEETENISIMEEEVIEEHHTTLTKEDIAKTTQIDVNEIEDMEDFLNKFK